MYPSEGPGRVVQWAWFRGDHPTMAAPGSMFMEPMERGEGEPPPTWPYNPTDEKYMVLRRRVVDYGEWEDAP